ncbi:unnamed protein product [Closterium sp. Naga37s-1]|nr:unnamed protein product [Closterium sp. Naga37s-1]
MPTPVEGWTGGGKEGGLGNEGEGGGEREEKDGGGDERVEKASTGDGNGCAVGSNFLSTVRVVRECEECGGRESGEEEFLCLSLPIPSSYPSYPACPAPNSTTAASAVAAAPARSIATARSSGGSRGSDTDPSAAGASLTHHPLSALLQHFFQEPTASRGNPQGSTTIPPPPSCQPLAAPSPSIAQHTRPLASRPPRNPSPPFPQENPFSVPRATAPPSAPSGMAPHATTDPASSRSPSSPLVPAAGAPSVNPFSLAKAAGRPVVLKEVAPKGVVCGLKGGGRLITRVSMVGGDAEGMDTGESVEGQLADRRNMKLEGREAEHIAGQWEEGEARECGEVEEDWAELLEGAAGVLGEDAGDAGDDSPVSVMVDGGKESSSGVGGGGGMEETEASRGRYECRKNVDRVEIATTLDVGPFCAPAMHETISQGEKRRDSSVFALRAVVRHTGTSVAHGHYIADVADDSLSPPGWTQLDDGVVIRNVSSSDNVDSDLVWTHVAAIAIILPLAPGYSCLPQNPACVLTLVPLLAQNFSFFESNLQVPEADVTASQSQKEAYMLFYVQMDS